MNKSTAEGEEELFILAVPLSWGSTPVRPETLRPCLSAGLPLQIELVNTFWRIVEQSYRVMIRLVKRNIAAQERERATV
jgi:hypothetical protein